MSKNKISKQEIQSGVIDMGAFNALQGERKGGKGERLLLEVGQAVAGITYKGTREIEIDGDDVTVHDGETADGKVVGLPLAASFNRQLEELAVKPGDVIAIGREPDAVKKKGKGKGNKLRVFRVVVQARK